MTEHERRLRKTFDHLAERTRAESRLDRFPSSHRRRGSAPVMAAAAFLLALGFGLPIALRSPDRSLGPVGQGPGPSFQQPVSTSTSPGGGKTTDTTSGETPGEDVVVGLVEVEVSNAVAPFDHDSNVDDLLLGFGLSRVRVGLINDCLAAEGFPPIQLAPLPDRDDPILMANRAFPYLDALAESGFPNLPGTPGSPEDSRQRSEAEAAASRQCAEEVDASDHDVIVAYELSASIRSAWEVVLAEIDATAEIQSLVVGFSSCLVAEGIPATNARSEGSFLGYVDSLLAATGADESAWPEIRERMGKLYVECGRELFEARERLRSGERREAFLRGHEEAIRELSELLYGAGASTP
ncbi:MAG: hypothetical protein Q8Q29_08115 [Actinomycetota bacterium]|nr:hypothetical protein [Actinomycetota bacterium]